MGWSEVAQLASKADVDAVAADVAGKAPKASPTFTGTVTAPAVKLTTGAGAGKVLTSAADGTASWAAPAPAGAPGVVVNGNPVGSPPTGTVAAGNGAIAIGQGAQSAVDAIAIGNGADAAFTSGDNGVAIGKGAKAQNATSVGQLARAVGSWNSAAFGFSAKADSGVAVGGSSTATYGFAIGDQATATGTSGNETVAIGRLSIANAGNATAVGRSAEATASGASAIGRAAKAAHSNSTAIGNYSETTAGSQVMLGSPYETVVSPNKHQIGPVGALSATLSTRTNGSGKTELIVQFATGSPVVIATQP